MPKKRSDTMMIGGVREMESMYENSTVVSVLGATRQSATDRRIHVDAPADGGHHELGCLPDSGNRKRTSHRQGYQRPRCLGRAQPVRPARVGAYLRKPLLNTWQVLVVPRLDRLTRSLDDFQRMAAAGDRRQGAGQHRRADGLRHRARDTHGPAAGDVRGVRALCRARHSARYADRAIMPTRWRDASQDGPGGPVESA